MSAALVLGSSSGEVRISLHPISLALVAAELIEDVARRRCRKSGHAPAGDEFCGRCGTHLPDNDTGYGSWFREAYRTVRPARTVPSQVG